MEERLGEYVLTPDDGGFWASIRSGAFFSVVFLGWMLFVRPWWAKRHDDDD